MIVSSKWPLFSPSQKQTLPMALSITACKVALLSFKFPDKYSSSSRQEFGAYPQRLDVSTISIKRNWGHQEIWMINRVSFQAVIESVIERACLRERENCGHLKDAIFHV